MEIAGRVAIEWPAPSACGTPLPVCAVRLHDVDTGRQLMTVTRLAMIVADCVSDEPIMAELTMLCDEQDRPLGPRDRPVFNEDGTVRTAVFRWAVVASTAAMPPTASLLPAPDISPDAVLDRYRVAREQR